MNISWTADGTALAGAGGNGTICFAQVSVRGRRHCFAQAWRVCISSTW